MSLDSLKGKKVFGVKTDKHHTTTGIDITFTDGTVLHISAYGQGDIRTDIRRGDPPKEKAYAWRKNEEVFLAKLSEDDKKEYQQARKAFFWLLDHCKEVYKHYSYFNKSWQENTRQFTMQIDKEVDDPEGILTIFLSSHVAPECDDWFVLGKKRDWKRILEMYEEVQNGKNKNNG